MADGDGFEAPGFEAADQAVEVCPECGHEETGKVAKLRMGLHRRQQHGVQGKGEKKAKGRTASRPPAQPRPPRAQTSAGIARQVEKEMELAYRGVGAGLSLFDPQCGAAIVAAAPEAAKFYAEWAKLNPAFGEWLVGAGTAVGAMHITFMGIQAHLPILLAVTGHHLAPRAAARRAAREHAQAEQMGYVMDEPEYGAEPADQPAA